MPSFGKMSDTSRKLSGVNNNPTKKKAAATVGTARPSVVPTNTPKATVPSPVGSAGATANSLAWQGNAPLRFDSGGGGATSDPTTKFSAASLPPNGTNPYTGWASRFAPGSLQETVWRDPQLVLNAMYQDNGWSTASPMYSTLRDFYGADPQSLWLLLSGNKQGAFGDADNYANFLHSLYGNYMTPGGRGVDFNEVLGILGGIGDQSGLAAQDQSPLWQLLTSGGPAEQVRSLYGLLGDAARVSLSPAIASAFMDALARQSDSYLTQANTSAEPIGPYYQWWQNPMLG